MIIAWNIFKGFLILLFAKEWFYKNGKKRGIGVDIGVEKLRQFPIKKTTKEEKENIESIVIELNLNYSKELEDKLNKIVTALY